MFCETDFCISLGKFKFGSPKAIEELAKALVENIWRVHGKDITADSAGWMVCAPAYRFVPNSAVLMTRRVHELLVARCMAEHRGSGSGGVPGLVELYRESITGGGGVDYASLGHESREKALPRFSVRGLATGLLTGKRILAIDDTRIYGVHALRTTESLRALGCTVIHHFFVLVTTQAMLERGCASMQVEDRINGAVVSPEDEGAMFCGWTHLQHILLEEGYVWTMRPVTWLLRRPVAHVAVVLDFLAEKQPRLLGELHAAVRKEHLHENRPEAAALLEEAVAANAARRAEARGGRRRKGSGCSTDVMIQEGTEMR